MKNVIFLLVLSIIGCASVSSKNDPYSFSNVKNFVMGKTTAQEVEKALGHSVRKTEKEEYYSLDFNDPQTGFQRVSASFKKADSTLMSILWIPTETDPQITLSSAMGKTNSSAFDVEISEEDKVHGLSTVKFFIDKKNGKTIRYNEALKQVEGIAFFDPSKKRTPAAKK